MTREELEQQFHSEWGLIADPELDALLNVTSGKAVDTGATGTRVSQTRLLELGYDTSHNKELHQVTTGSGIEFVPFCKSESQTLLIVV